MRWYGTMSAIGSQRLQHAAVDEIGRADAVGGLVRTAKVGRTPADQNLQLRIVRPAPDGSFKAAMLCSKGRGSVIGGFRSTLPGEITAIARS